jgi:hypothetical protein
MITTGSRTAWRGAFTGARPGANANLEKKQKHPANVTPDEKCLRVETAELTLLALCTDPLFNLKGLN